MTELPFSQCSDEDLVEAVRTPQGGRQAAAYDELWKRHRGLLTVLAHRRTAKIGQMLSNLERGSIDHLVGDVMGKAIRHYKRGKGAQFKTYVGRILMNEMTSGARRKGKFAATLDARDGEDGHPEPAARVIPPGSMAHVTLIEIGEIARASILALREAERQVFVWAVVLDYSHAQLQDLCPDKSPEALRKLKQRATETFFVEWDRRGGSRAEELLGELGPAMAERLDPERIKDPKARDAYRAWLTGDLASAARATGLDIDKTRALLLSAAHDLYEQATLRGRSRVLAQILDIGEGATPADPLLARARRTIALVRAAFGVAPLEAAFTTLGAFLHARLRTAADCESARKALGLSPADFRLLLADQLDPGADTLKRLARFLETPLASLKALPRTPLGPPDVVTRGAGRLDHARIRERALSWIAPPRRARRR
ncbi:MAG: sigma-70 family RNA polymerase sigma factor [Planctomycetes bacterium]|nr:sigma-70 family RNA polymerase sigma factor [Planctomycetota bacterium]